MNERKTEDLVEGQLRDACYHSSAHITVEKQQSARAPINNLLTHASKSGSGAGRPEFIISSSTHSHFIIVIECKADVLKHESARRNRPRDYAVDGVLHYASFLARQFDVLAIAVSGESEEASRTSHFLHLKGSADPVDWDVSSGIAPFDEYYNAFVTSDIKFRQDYDALLEYSRALNDRLQAEKVTEAQRAFLVSGVLIALKNRAFRQSYRSHQTVTQLASALVTTIGSEFENAGIAGDRRELLTSSFSFIRGLPTTKHFLEELVDEIDNNVNSFMRTYRYYDTIGQFYVEFLRYANNDKGLGIVLTPPHIAELFALLANVNRNSIVFDNCCGTAGLLIAAMNQMIKDAGANSRKKKAIRSRQLIGTEYQPTIYTLAVCNMILHDDGKANVDRADCFDKSHRAVSPAGRPGRRMSKPTVGLLNPPYKNKRMRGDRQELEFVLNNLEQLEQDGCCVAIVPITCATNPSGAIGELKRRLLEKHTLEAVMSMPTDLFHNSKTMVVTCVMVFTAHRPHPRGKKTWFGYWRDDGFIKTKHRGRIDKKGVWPEIRDQWLAWFRNREVVDGFSTMEEVRASDEWCVEAYLPVDYDSIQRKALFEAAQKHFIHQIL